jgi:hypothetical protein
LLAFLHLTDLSIFDRRAFKGIYRSLNGNPFIVSVPTRADIRPHLVLVLGNIVYCSIFNIKGLDRQNFNALADVYFWLRLVGDFCGCMGYLVNRRSFLGFKRGNPTAKIRRGAIL